MWGPGWWQAASARRNWRSFEPMLARTGHRGRRQRKFLGDGEAVDQADLFVNRHPTAHPSPTQATSPLAPGDRHPDRPRNVMINLMMLFRVIMPLVVVARLGAASIGLFDPLTIGMPAAHLGRLWLDAAGSRSADCDLLTQQRRVAMQLELERAATKRCGRSADR